MGIPFPDVRTKTLSKTTFSYLTYLCAAHPSNGCDYFKIISGLNEVIKPQSLYYGLTGLIRAFICYLLSVYIFIHILFGLYLNPSTISAMLLFSWLLLDESISLDWKLPSHSNHYVVSYKYWSFVKLLTCQRINILLFTQIRPHHHTRKISVEQKYPYDIVWS